MGLAHVHRSSPQGQRLKVLPKVAVPIIPTGPGRSRNHAAIRRVFSVCGDITKAVSDSAHLPICARVVRRWLCAVAFVPGKSLSTSLSGVVAIVHVDTPSLFGRADVILSTLMVSQLPDICFHYFLQDFLFLQYSCTFLVPSANWDTAVITMTPTTKPSLPLVLPGSLAVKSLVSAFLSTSGAVSLKSRIAKAKKDPDEQRTKDQDQTKYSNACRIRELIYGSGGRCLWGCRTSGQ